MSAFTHKEESIMFNYKPVTAQLREVQKKNIQLQQESKQVRADLDFVACMCDVEIPEEEEDEI